MKKINLLLATLLILTFTLLISSCSIELNNDIDKEYYFLSKEDQTDTSKPWFSQVNIATSTDGITFIEQGMLTKQAGVANLLKTKDNELIAIYQYFDPFIKENFDQIAYQISTDNGQTWSERGFIQYEELPYKPKPGRPSPVDPDLVQLEDGSLRLYFTYPQPGYEYAFMAVSTADSITDNFVFKGPALSLDDTLLLDPAIVYFNDMWHHYTWTNEKNSEGVNINVHSTSKDGLTFERQDDIYLPMNFLGQAIVIDEELYFYGSGMKGPVAKSTNGFEWEISSETNVLGADPGITQLDDGSFVMIYTNMNFN
ncbi:exo-alpha-sialidase [archaeon]|jgi:hypothetical protein|nr:exo-alpha-sialidase [archaeon]MBT6698574.1 exo-alpha-sialidase [archaeon]